MNFSELETLMSSRGVTTLAEIARTLNTTPQAVSNWKARDQVPHHIVAKLNQSSTPTADSSQTSDGAPVYSSPVTHYASPSIYEKDSISLSDILLTMATQIKVILFIPFITIFITFTYVMFMQQPLYESSATLLLPKKSSNLDGIAGLASQFGVNVPNETGADLSSPSIFPELVQSRTFAEKILKNYFYTDRYKKKLSLLAILTYGDGSAGNGRDTLVTNALGSLQSMIQFLPDPRSSFSIIKVTAFEPLFAKELAEAVLSELEALNRYLKSQTVNEKINFINERINSVEEDLKSSEQRFKSFNEQNRQISSPSLQLELDRLSRDVEIQKGIYLTLKQQLELAKIEEVQETSIVQVLDRPQVPLGPSNKNFKRSVMVAAFLGLGLGILFGFIRSYMNNNDIDERRKLRRVRNFLNKKLKDAILDRRISGIVSLLLLFGLPYYLGHKSANPVFFGMYSTKLMIINTIYILIIILSISIFIYLTLTRKKT